MHAAPGVSVLPLWLSEPHAFQEDLARTQIIFLSGLSVSLCLPPKITFLSDLSLSLSLSPPPPPAWHALSACIWGTGQEEVELKDIKSLILAKRGQRDS